MIIYGLITTSSKGYMKLAQTKLMTPDNHYLMHSAVSDLNFHACGCNSCTDFMLVAQRTYKFWNL